MWIDSHAHLAGLDDTACAAACARATEARVDRIVNVGTSLDECQRAIQQAARHPVLKVAVGVSPFDVTDTSPDWEQQLAAFCEEPVVVAVGETGLDATNPTYPPRERQLPFFEAQARLARDTDLPLIVHSRGAELECLNIVREIGVPRVVFHCFTGTLGDARAVLDAGYVISLSGILTFKNSPLPELLACIPLDRLLIETDAPYLAPVPHRGKTNEPAWVSLVGARVAEILDSPEAQVAAQLRETYTRVFSRDTGPAI